MPTKVKKILGVLAIIAGFIALITPFTPGAAWFLFIGFQFLGFHFTVWDKLFPPKDSLKKHD